MFRFIAFLISLVVVLLVFIFTLENLDPITINFLVQNLQVPLGIVMLICFVIGALLGLLFSTSLVLKHRRRAKSLAKKVVVVEQEVANLRQLPIKSSH
jgi:putative membrane protein